MSPAPVFVGPEVENKRQSKYATLILALVALALIGTAFLARDMYVHPTPPSDCSGAEDYVATCVRATAPSPAAPPSDIALYLGTLGTAVVAVILVHAGWSASVTKQAEIVSTFAGGPTSSAVSTATSTTVATTQSVSTNQLPPPLGPHPVAAKDTHALVKQSPTTIVANRITPDMIAPPKVAPKKGVDPKIMEGKNNG